MLARLSKMIGKEVGGVSTVKILRRLEECSIPSDKPQIVSMLEVLDEKLEFDYKETTKAFQDLNAVPLLFHIMEQMKKVGAVAFLAVQLFVRFEKCPSLMLVVVELGGLSLLDEMINYHSKNKFLSVVIPDLIKLAKEIGIKQAVLEINNESQSLEFCSHCQEIAQRKKDKELKVNAAKRLNQPNAFKGTIVPTGCERINKATFFMREYALADTVQIAALDAIIVFARSGDAYEAIKDTIAIEAAGNALINFPANEKVVWRVALLLSLLARLRMSYAMEICTVNVHDLMCRNFPLYRISPNVQQTILWMLNGLVSWPRSRHEIQRSEVCMTLLNTLDYRTAAAKENEMNKIVLPRFGEISQAYQIIIPLKIQEFMRETKGVMLKVDKYVDLDLDKEKVLRKKRERLTPAPRYGDVKSKLFTPGLQGLNDGSPAKLHEAKLLSTAEGILAYIETENISPQQSPKKSTNQNSVAEL